MITIPRRPVMQSYLKLVVIAFIIFCRIYDLSMMSRSMKE